MLLLLTTAGNLGIMLFNMTDNAAAEPLLREAMLQGLAEVYSAESESEEETTVCTSGWRSAAEGSRQLAGKVSAECTPVWVPEKSMKLVSSLA